MVLERCRGRRPHLDLRPLLRVRPRKTTGTDSTTMTTPILTPEAEGYKMASVYMTRQHWKMKWVALLISGAMATYTIQTNTWILEIGVLVWAGLMLSIGWSQWQLNKLFVDHVKHMREGNEYPLPMIMKAIVQHAWIQWGLSLIAWYWILTLGYITFFTEVTTGP